MFSNQLILLILFSKKEGSEFNYESLKELLGEMYNYNMSKRNILDVLLSTYDEALNHKQFEIPFRSQNTKLISELLMSPFKSFLYDLTPKIPESLNSDHIFNSYYNHILTTFMLSNIGWCKEHLGLPEGQIIISDELLNKAKNSLIKSKVE